MKIVRKDGIEYERTKHKIRKYEKKVCIKISTEQQIKAKERCEQLKISFNELVRKGIDMFLNKEVELNENN